MASKYRKFDPRTWSDEKFVALSEAEKLIAIYCFTSRQANRVGLFVFSPALAAEELGTSPQTFRERFRKVRETFRWGWDEDLRVLYLPSWWKFNPPENPNVLKSCLDDLEDLPQTPLLGEFYSNTRHLPERLHQTFRATLPQTYGTSGTGTGTGTGAGNPPTPRGGSDSRNSLDVPSVKKRHADDATAVPIPPELNEPNFLAAWSKWLAVRRGKKKPVTETAAKSQLGSLAKIGPQRAIECIENSIANDWQGLFPEKHSGPSPKSTGFRTRGERDLDFALDQLQGLGEPE